MAFRQKPPEVPEAIHDDCADEVRLLLADHTTDRSMLYLYDDLIDEDASIEEERELALLIGAEFHHADRE